MPGKDHPSAKGLRASCWFVAVVVGLALVAWASRWEPELAFELESVDFAIGPSGHPPDGNCFVTARVCNSGSGNLGTWGIEGRSVLSSVEWNPPMENDPVMSQKIVILKTGEEVTTLAYRHVPEGLDRIRFRFTVDVFQPSAWRERIRDWLFERVDPFDPRIGWLFGALDGKSRVIHSPWFEAEVPSNPRAD